MRTRKRRGVRAVGQHSSASEDWGTDPEVIAKLRTVLGRFDVDPASSPKWNRVIGAKRIITKRQDGRRTPWVPGAPPPRDIRGRPARARLDERAIVNAPGEESGENVATYWYATAGYYDLGWLSCAGWIGFSVEQLSRLQRVGAASHPLLHVTCVPEKRRKYSIKPGTVGEQPGHASFITLLPRDRTQVSIFVAEFRELGHVVVGDRWRR
jgi:hypothetical protein